MPIQFGGPGVTPSLGSLVTTTLNLNTGSVWCMPAGRWSVKSGPYTTFQEYDPIVGIWRSIGAGPTDAFLETLFADGSNYRLGNQTGAPVGAAVTAGGTGYTAAPTWAPSAGGSVWRSVLGGAINTTISITNGGLNYTYPPTVLISPPPPGGVPASAHCTIAAGAVNAIVVDNQGGGYTVPPTVTFIPDPREGAGGGSPAAATITQGSGASAVTTLTGAGTVTALVCLDHGQGGQAAVPTLTPSSGAAAATAIMCWSITAVAVSTTTGGSGYAAPITIGGYAATPLQTANVNPYISSQLVRTRPAYIIATAVSGTGISPGSILLQDGGVYTAAPTMYSSSYPPGAGAVAATLTPTMGGQNDTSLIVQT